jgi:hypothetical protein
MTKIFIISILILTLFALVLAIAYLRDNEHTIKLLFSEKWIRGRMAVSLLTIRLRDVFRRFKGRDKESGLDRAVRNINSIHFGDLKRMVVASVKKDLKVK